MGSSARHARARDIFFRALEVPVEGRVAFVEAHAALDGELAREVLSLLAHHDDAPLMARDRGAPATERMPRTALPRDPDPLGLQGTTLDGRYRVDALVDEGGFSYVYRADHVLWGRPLALKFYKEVRPTSDRQQLEEAFLREGALLNELSRRTSAIVHSYDVGTLTLPSGGALLFTVLEWLEGRTLARLLEEERGADGAAGRPLERIVPLLDPIAEALAIAHEEGIAHRDVKPSNVFLVEQRGTTTAKLIDFGVAKVAGPEQRFELTGGAPRAFTIAYAAPEQMRRTLGPSGPWSDVYSLALVCVELMLGRYPGGPPTTMVDAATRACDPSRRPTPRAAGVEVTDAVEAVFTMALCVQPGARFSDARRFWQALRAALGRS